MASVAVDLTKLSQEELIKIITELEYQLEKVNKEGSPTERDWLKERRQRKNWEKKYKELEATLKKKENTGDVKLVY